MHGLMLCTGRQEDVARILRSLRSGRREMERLCEVSDSNEDTSEEDDEEVVASTDLMLCLSPLTLSHRH